MNNSMWWNGPNSLHNEIIEFPSVDILTTDLEQQLHKIGVNVADTSITDATMHDIPFQEFDTFDELLQFIDNRISGVKNTDSEEAVMDDTAQATRRLFQFIQDESFRDGIALLKKKLLPNSNNLIALSPWLDEDGILRVGGRLKNSNLSFEARHQILLPKNHKVTELIIKQCHRKPYMVVQN